MLDIQSLMAVAFAEAARTPPELLQRQGALAVGAVLVIDGEIAMTAYSGENGGTEHAEFALIQKARNSDLNIAGSVVVLTHEPCGKRTIVGAISCADVLIEANVAEVFYCHAEPKPDFRGGARLSQKGVQVTRAILRP
jgi:pyrimidine deaminase RibD-like protein